MFTDWSVHKCHWEVFATIRCHSRHSMQTCLIRFCIWDIFSHVFATVSIAHTFVQDARHRNVAIQLAFAAAATTPCSYSSCLHSRPSFNPRLPSGLSTVLIVPSPRSTAPAPATYSVISNSCSCLHYSFSALATLYSTTVPAISQPTRFRGLGLGRGYGTDRNAAGTQRCSCWSRVCRKECRDLSLCIFLLRIFS